MALKLGERVDDRGRVGRKIVRREARCDDQSFQSFTYRRTCGSFPREMSPRPIAAHLSQLIDRFEWRRVAVIGDPVLDVYLYGTTHRISREAPVLIVREDSREHRLGGAANTAANLAALGAKAQLIGLVGADDDGSRLIELARARGLDNTHIARRRRGCTVTKTRVLAGSLHTTKQQMLRIDRENDVAPEQSDVEKLSESATAAIDTAEALIISDYGDGTLTPTYAQIAAEAMRLKKIVVVDSRRSLDRYKGVTAVTPNEPEAEASLNVRLRTPEDAAKAAMRLLHELNVTATVLTRGREGMAVAEKGKDAALIPAHGGHEAVDVTGAGDTVTATFTLALTAGASILDASVIANCAASIVVQSIGAATCSPDELRSTLWELTTGEA
jgi:D-glycero-beta-D-manno-heptose-7-phosphate kinase